MRLGDRPLSLGTRVETWILRFEGGGKKPVSQAKEAASKLAKLQILHEAASWANLVPRLALLWRLGTPFLGGF